MIQRKTLASEEASYSNDVAAKKKSDISQDVNRAKWLPISGRMETLTWPPNPLPQASDRTYPSPLRRRQNID
jgi:hypothetical protein